MKTTADYIQELKALHGGIVGKPEEGYRMENVICVDKLDREIIFTPPADIAAKMDVIMTSFALDFAAAQDKMALSTAFAKFYYGFIAIHPFMDGNRRTAFAFIEARAAEKSRSVHSLHLLQKFMFEGNVMPELLKLTALFSHILTPPQGA